MAQNTTNQAATPMASPLQQQNVPARPVQIKVTLFIIHWLYAV